MNKRRDMTYTQAYIILYDSFLFQR